MKKITLSLITALLAVGYVHSQVTTTVIAPPYDGSTTQLRAPNGNASQAGMRGCFIIPQVDMGGFNFTNSIINNFGFFLAQGTAAVPVTGAITIYVQNTSDATYLKGTNWPTAITSMTTIYSGAMTIPATNNNTLIMLPVTQFTYTGGGLYVAYNWTSSGPFDANAATYFANSAMTSGTQGGATCDTPTLPTPATMSVTNFRPCFLFTAANTLTNEIEVESVYSDGKIPYLVNATYSVVSEIRNNSNVTRTNIPVGLGISGANTFNSAQVIPSLAAGASTFLTFTGFNPTNLGVNSVSVGVGPDQVNNNNFSTWGQSVTCVVGGAAPAAGTYTFALGIGGTSTGIILNRLTSSVNTNLSGVRLAISSSTTTVGTPVYGVLLNSTGVQVATTNTIIVTSGMLGTFQNFVFPSLQPIAAGSTNYIGMALPTAGTFPLGVLTTGAGYFIPNNLSVLANIGGGALTTLAANWHLGIEAVFSPTGYVISVVKSPSVTCPGQPVTLTASGMNNFAWGTTPTLTNSITDSPTSSTTYTVTGLNTAAPLCPIVSQVSHSVIVLPNVSIATLTQNPICRGRSVKLTALGAVPIYSWTSVTTNTNNITVTPTVTTTYSVYGSEPLAGCKTNTAAITVTVNACLGIAVNGSNFSDVNIFPNPASNGKSEISGLSGVNTITIYNLLGQAVLTEKTEQESFILDFSNQPNGTYLVKISDANNDSKIVKIINQN
jgi:hypothetical protein